MFVLIPCTTDGKTIFKKEDINKVVEGEHNTSKMTISEKYYVNGVTFFKLSEITLGISVEEVFEILNT